jgi:hypothetical protein
MLKGITTARTTSLAVSGAFLLALVVLASFSGFAQDDTQDTQPCVKITRIAGCVRVERSGAEPVNVGIGDLLYAGDVLFVDKDAKVQLTFPGNTLVLLKENSVLSLRELAPDGRTRSALTAGYLLANLKEALSPGATFEVETPTALAVVRGTVFEVEFQEPDEEEDTPPVYFYGHQGEVELLFAEEVLLLGPGALIQLEKGKLPRFLKHSRKLEEVLQMFDPEYWEEIAEEKIEEEIRKRLPKFF